MVPPDLKKQRNRLPISAVISPQSRGSSVWENRNAAEGGTASRFSAVEAGELPSLPRAVPETPRAADTEM